MLTLLLCNSHFYSYTSVLYALSPHSREIPLFGTIVTGSAWGVSLYVHFIAFWGASPLPDALALHFWGYSKLQSSPHINHTNLVTVGFTNNYLLLTVFFETYTYKIMGI